MCKCKCCDEEDNIIKYYSDKIEEDNKIQSIRRDYIRRNAPIIIDLVGKYNKILNENTETYKDAVKKNELMDSLAIQICSYIKI